MDRTTIETYNRMAAEYDQETQSFWENFPDRSLKEFAKNVSGNVLDVGSGPGRDATLLKNQNLNVVCLDASTQMVKITADKDLSTVQADFSKLPFKDQTFDGIWAYTSLIHIPRTELPPTLVKLGWALKPGGVLGLGMIEGDWEGYRHSSGVDLPRYFSYYKRRDLEAILQHTGFDIFFFDEFKPRSKNYLNILARRVYC